MFSRKWCTFLRHPACSQSSALSQKNFSKNPGREVWVTDVQYKKFLNLLWRCRIIPSPSIPTSSIGSSFPLHFPLSAAEMRENAQYHIFSPLFTPSFDFHQQHLTAMGDSCIDSYLSSVLLKYSLRTNLVLSGNSARQWNSIFHHHLALRFLASELQFTELAIPLSQDFHLPTTSDEGQQSNGQEGSMSGSAEENVSVVERMQRCMMQLEARRMGPSKRDVTGTSFNVLQVLPCGQSPLGWKFSHFIGAVHLVFGPSAVWRALNAIYSLEESRNLMEAAARFLLRLLEVYPALSITESLLAAQGLRVGYKGKSRLMPEDAKGTMATLSTSRGSGPPPSPLAILSLTGFGMMRRDKSSPAGTVTGATESNGIAPSSGKLLTTLPVDVQRVNGEEENGHGGTLFAPETEVFPSNEVSAPSALEEPEQQHLIKEWQRRSAMAISQQQIAQGKKSSLPSINADHFNSLANPLEGWLSSEEQWAAQSSPAFWSAVDVAVHHSFADTYGVPDPVQGKIISRIKFKRSVRDPLFYDNLSDMKKGVPLDTDGMETTEGMLQVLQRPHRRLFSVTMFITSSADSEPKEIGKVTAWRYSVARDAASKAFLASVLHDFRRTHPTPR